MGFEIFFESISLSLDKKNEFLEPTFMLVITHFLFEAYKQDVTAQVIPITSYPNTFRRILIDFAVKITSRSRNIILNVTKTVYETISIEEIWKLCQSPPKIQLV